ncbi:cytochrome b5-like heme/steroid binding domain-containing protein [Fimicolochytrium jonesii]|uniref:cytochrome b5-like heme/steroid binding domain-containing protein n=1 Tax=Fimicolochytrium jonesii TaxID=1396493 RepID=UPI0022FE4F4F|nr:cytochrome b5-like heme/steroid binding domain-containing protein [Fimicolochytrium jonesii]KAI8823745.1 cytochrome b5-like heme/steroid binding domain-containing protein [Fimicolochytrium jonesii]
MSLHNRKQTVPASSPKPAAATLNHRTPAVPTTPTTTHVILRTLLVLILGSLMAAAFLSYLVTDSLTFGYTVPNWRRFVYTRPVTLTESELSTYDGSDPSKPIYIGINGKVYDVSASPQYYGPGGGYHFFAGKDAARAYITGCFKEHLTHDLRGLNEAQIKSLDTWTSFYADSPKYFYVGEVLHPPIDPDAPMLEDCNQ